MLCCAQMAAAIDLLFGRHVDSGGPKEALLDGRAHWRNLANTTEPSVCNGNAALCQITMTICYYYLTICYYYFHSFTKCLSVEILQIAGTDVL